MHSKKGISLEEYCKDNFPNLLDEWHPTKNGILKPSDVSYASNKKVWWYLPYDDPKTGKHFDFEWEASIANRIHLQGCPFLTGKAVLKGFNDLATTHPEIAAEWHPTKNGDLKPIYVTVNSAKKVWWYFPYDDPKTGKHFDFEWVSSIVNRVKGRNCPFLPSHSVWYGFNDLETYCKSNNLEYILDEWDYENNGELTPKNVTYGSSQKVWWVTEYEHPKNGNKIKLHWICSVNKRTSSMVKCPYLTGKKVLAGFNDLATVSPQLAAEWHPTKNGDLKPTDVTAYSHKKVWWLYPYDDPKTGKHFDFEWEAMIANRSQGSGCPYNFEKMK